MIIHGDCLEELKKMSDCSVDVVFTSPPYNRKRNDKYDHYTDIIDDYFSFLVETTEEMLRVSRGHVFLNVQKNYYNKAEVNKFIGHFSEEIVEIIIWQKTNPMPAAGKAITNAYEFFFVLGKKPLKSNSTYTKNILSTGVNSKMPQFHKAVMKYEVAEWFINNFTQKDDVVLDPFAGVGTTGLACKNLKRRFILVEKNIEYYKYCFENI